MGLSLGGYETAFVLSKSKLFAAGVAASPAVDWANDFLIGRQGNVHSEAAYLRSIGMTVPFWDDPESYVANSLIYQAHAITAPLLIGIGRQDPVVDCRDGESIYNLLRYLKRPVCLVAYPRGGHGLSEDFSRRAQQFCERLQSPRPTPGSLARSPAARSIDVRTGCSTRRNVWPIAFGRVSPAVECVLFPIGGSHRLC